MGDHGESPAFRCGEKVNIRDADLAEYVGPRSTINGGHSWGGRCDGWLFDTEAEATTHAERIRADGLDCTVRAPFPV